MAKRITAMLLVILLLAGIMPSVYATEGETDGEEAIVLASSGDTVTITVDRNRQIQWIGHTDAKLNLSYKDAKGVTRGGYMTAVNVTKVDGVIAYCIEPCVEFGTKYTEDESIAAWMTQLTANQRSAIALAMAYGYPNTEHPAASDPGVSGDSSLEYPLRTDLWQISERYAATQIIIWEIVTGKRSAVAPYTCTDSSLYSSFYSTNNPYGYRADWNTLRDTYKRISDSMAGHKSVPSFSSSNLSNAPTHELTYNAATGKYETTLTDTNKVLSGYDFKCSVSGVTITRSGNTLKISATAEAAAKLNGVTVSAAGTMLDIDPEKVVAVWAAEGAGQTAVTLKSSPDPVTAYFKLKAEATTEVKIVKTTNTGKNLSGWQINLYTDAACTKKVSGSPFTTGSDGTITVDGLTPGTYYAKEVPSTDPYWVSDTSVKTVKAEAGKTATVTFSNTHYGDLRVKKNIEAKINRLKMLLSVVPDMEIVCADSCERFDDNKSYLSKRAREESSPQIKSLLLLDRDMLTDLQAEMSTARQFVLVKRYYGLKSSVVFHEANEIQKKIAEAGFEVRRMKKPEIKRFLAIYFGASMDGDQMPDVDGGQYVKEEANEAVQQKG